MQNEIVFRIDKFVVQRQDEIDTESFNVWRRGYERFDKIGRYSFPNLNESALRRDRKMLLRVIRLPLPLMIHFQDFE